MFWRSPISNSTTLIPDFFGVGEGKSTCRCCICRSVVPEDENFIVSFHHPRRCCCRKGDSTRRGEGGGSRGRGRGGMGGEGICHTAITRGGIAIMTILGGL